MRASEVLVSLTATARTREQQLARLKGQQADLERLLEQLDSLAAERPGRPTPTSAFGRLRGTLAWPVAGRITAHFGEQRAGDVRWDGMVIATARDAPVRAVSAGRVVYADWLPGLGLLLIIDHGDGYLSLYGHNDRLFKAVGDSVQPGETDRRGRRYRRAGRARAVFRDPARRPAGRSAPLVQDPQPHALRPARGGSAFRAPHYVNSDFRQGHPDGRGGFCGVRRILTSGAL